ncbi:MAG TPA: UDP-N-acetylmuramate dehydrogenase [Candidatus Paceibacterota bacterium]
MTISENINLSQFTTLKIGGPARYFCAVTSEAELEEALAFAKSKSVRIFILGGGSNVLVGDPGFNGLVIKMEMKGIEFEKSTDGKSVLVTVAAGEAWDDLVAKTVEKGAWGLENLSLIPGTVGAAPVQNIGAYGTEVMNVIESVRAIDTESGAARVFSNAECGFTYRDSIFKRAEYKKYVIVSVSFSLSLSPAPNFRYKDIKEYFAAKKIASPTQLDIRNAVIEVRTAKFPNLGEVGTAGSFWKNPIIPRAQFESLALRYPGIPAFPANAPAGSREVGADESTVKIPLAWVLDSVCGLKGFALGKAFLFSRQPLVLVAEHSATSTDVDRLAAHVADIVLRKTGIIIEKEVGSL